MLPLDNVRVVEFCQIAAGPFCGMLLADMGADVIKVESREGDGLRQWPPHNEGYSENFASLNRNKRSVVLDLKREEDRQAARRLVLDADILIENFRPGVMARNGLDYASLSAEKPSLIYCSISAFGQSGPRAFQGGFDLSIQAMSGIMSVTGEAGRPPVKCGVPISDFCAGLYAAYSILAVLNQVRRGGRGEHIDVSMLGASLGVAALQTSEYFGTRKDPKCMGSAHPRNAPYQAFRASDGYFTLAAGNDRLWKSLCMEIGCDDLSDDPRFATVQERAANQEALRDLLEGVFKGATAAEWIDRFTARGIPCAPLNTYSQVLADPQVRHMGWVQQIVLPNGATTQTVTSPVRLTGKGLGVFREPPALGAHTEEVISALQGRKAQNKGGQKKASGRAQIDSLRELEGS